MGAYSTYGEEWLLFWTELNFILLEQGIDDVGPH